MQRTTAHQIDKTAQNVLHNCLPASWIINKLDEDYAKDYHVEIVDDIELTGTAFFVQLKGKAAVVYSKNKKVVCFQLETKHAAYYLDRVQDLPVFLIVVDTTNELAWYIHVQPLLESDQSWRKQKSVGVRLPVENLLSETSKLRTAVVHAKRWLRARNPASLREAITAQAERIRAIDPRFTLSVASQSDTGLELHLTSSEPIHIDVEPLSKESMATTDKLDLLDRGKPVRFDPGEVRVHGSKVFEEIERRGGTLQHTSITPGNVTITVKDAKDKKLAELLEMPGDFRGGKAELWFSGSLSKSPLSFSFGPFYPPPQHKDGGHTTINVKVGNWNGQKLRKLSYFDRVYAFISALGGSVSSDLEISVFGNTVFSATSEEYDLAARFSGLARYLKVIYKARCVCAHFGVDPIWSTHAFGRFQIDVVEEMYGLLFEGGYTNKFPHMEMNAIVVRDATRFDLIEKMKLGQIKLISDCTYSLLGESLIIDNIEQDISEATFVIPKRTRRSQAFRELRVGEIQAKIVGTENTVRALRVAPRELLENKGKVNVFNLGKDENTPDSSANAHADRTED
jgi:hypothetical protein